MSINPLIPFVLIPWDHILFDSSGENHVIIVTPSMVEALSNLSVRKNVIYHQTNVIGVSCLYDKCLDYSDQQLEEVYEDIKEELFKRKAPSNHQEWFFGNRILLKEFEQFFPETKVQYLDPCCMFDPCTLFVSNKTKSLVFSHPRPHEFTICVH